MTLRMTVLTIISYITCNNASERPCTQNSATGNSVGVLRFIWYKRLIKIDLYISESLSDHFKCILYEKCSYEVSVV